MATKHTVRRTQVAGWLRIRSRTAANARAAHSDPGPPPRYFTDGVNLYRFVGWVSRSVNVMFAELEDCRSLDVLLISFEDLTRCTLQPVSTSSAT